MASIHQISKTNQHRILKKIVDGISRPNLLKDPVIHSFMLEHFKEEIVKKWQIEKFKVKPSNLTNDDLRRADKANAKENR